MDILDIELAADEIAIHLITMGNSADDIEEFFAEQGLRIAEEIRDGLF